MATEQPMGLSLASEVKRQIWESSIVDHILNWDFHCSTDTEELPKTRQRLRTVHAAVTPTRDLPAPGKQRRQKIIEMLFTHKSLGSKRVYPLFHKGKANICLAFCIIHYSHIIFKFYLFVISNYIFIEMKCFGVISVLSLNVSNQLSHRRAARWPQSEHVHSQTSCVDSFPGRGATQQWASDLCWCLGWLYHSESRTLLGGGTPAEYNASAALQSSPTPDRRRIQQFRIGHKNMILGMVLNLK